MRAILLLPFPFDLIAALLLVPVMLVGGAIEEAAAWLRGGDAP